MLETLLSVCTNIFDNIFIVVCFLAAIAESISMTTYVLIKNGNCAAFFTFFVLFFFSFFDFYNILRVNFVTAFSDLASVFSRKGSFFVKLLAFILTILLFASFASFAHYHYGSMYFTNYLLLNTYFSTWGEFIPLILQVLIIPCSIANAVNVLNNSIRFVVKFYNFVSGNIDEYKNVTGLFYSVVYLCSVSLAFCFAEASYISLQYGMQHYLLITNETSLFASLPSYVLVGSMFLATMQTMSGIISATSKFLINNKKVSLFERCSKLTLYGNFSYLLRAYAKAIASSLSISRGYYSTLLYQFADKSSGDPINSKNFNSIFKSRQKTSTEKREYKVLDSLRNVFRSK